MTKTVRIENADSGTDHKIQVREQHFVNGEWHDATSAIAKLDYPTSMVNATVWENKRLIVEEYK